MGICLNRLIILIRLIRNCLIKVISLKVNHNCWTHRNYRNSLPIGNYRPPINCNTYLSNSLFFLILGPVTVMAGERMTLVGLSTSLTECSSPAIYLRVSSVLEWILSNSDARKYQKKSGELNYKHLFCFRMDSGANLVKKIPAYNLTLRQIVP